MKIKELADKLVKKLEHALTSSQKLVVAGGTGLILLLSIITIANLVNDNDPIANSVSILNRANTSGGSGVVLKSSDHESVVLTNAHVCSLVATKGGVVKGVHGTFAVALTKMSEEHDLCLIKVVGNLKAETTVASAGPREFYEKATISGHPNLFPTVVTSGHFSGRQFITVVVGFRECTDEDRSNKELETLCIILRRMPIIRSYDSALVTATIMPGSSGSPVYNESNELAGLVFAGSGELGYAWTVPFSALKRFLSEEQNKLLWTAPSSSLDILDLLKPSRASSEDFERQLEKLCNNTENANIKNFCNSLESDALWRK